MRGLLLSLLGNLINQLKRYGIAYRVGGLVEELKRLYRRHLKSEYYKKQAEQTAESVGSGLWVGREVSLNSKTRIGDNVHFWEMNVHGEGSVTIGDNFHSGSGCMIISADHNYDDGDAIPYDDTRIPKEVSVGDNVWFGKNVSVLSGVTIEEGAIIQAGSVVTDDVPKGAIAGGHPAEVFDYRDMKHYEKLKEEGKFY